MQPVVGVILGSKSDLPLMESCVKVLEDLGLTHELKVCSAHRNPRGVMEWATSARSRGLKVVIAAAGGAAHLPGVVAAWTDLPVIGVPVPTQHLQGIAIAAVRGKELGKRKSRLTVGQPVDHLLLGFRETIDVRVRRIAT